MIEHLHLGTTLRRIVFGLALLIVAARIAAPYAIERYVDDELDGLEGYTGHIDDVDLNLWRGAYEVEGLVIEKTGGKVPVPFVKLQRLDLGVQWGALLDGAVVARVSLIHPEVNFVKGPSKASSQAGTEADWQQTLEDLVPLRIDKLTVVDGEVHYRDFQSTPRVDVLADHLNVTVTNLTNSKQFTNTRVAGVSAQATVMRSGQLSIVGNIDPFAERPTFDLKTRMEHLKLAQLNPFLRAYAGVDAEKGTVALYSEVTSQDGAFKGYIKPMIEGLDLLEWEKENESTLTKLWEGLVGGVAEIFKNQPHDRLATKIPIAGKFNQPDVKIWRAMLSLLRNAFIEALRHGLANRAS